MFWLTRAAHVQKVCISPFMATFLAHRSSCIMATFPQRARHGCWLRSLSLLVEHLGCVLRSCSSLKVAAFSVYARQEHGYVRILCSSMRMAAVPTICSSRDVAAFAHDGRQIIWLRSLTMVVKSFGCVLDAGSSYTMATVQVFCSSNVVAAFSSCAPLK
jgi:hypothetical protein